MESDTLNSGVATLNEPRTVLDIASGAHLTAADFTVSDATRAHIVRSVAPNTTIAYARCWDQFTRWCADNGRTALPTTPQVLADYMTHMVDADPPRSIATCRQAIAAIRTQNRVVAKQGRNSPDLELATAVLKSAGRDRAEQGIGGQRKSAPIIVEALAAMVATCNGDSLIDLRDHALLTLGIAIFGRRSELSELQLQDLRPVPQGIRVNIRKSKTDQSGKGHEVAVLHGVKRTVDLGTDPVKAVATWRTALADRSITDGRLFRTVERGRIFPAMSPAAINLMVRDRAHRAGVENPESYTAHSLRAGAATIAYMNGAPISEICRLGRWSEKSSVVLGYIRAVDEWRNHPFRGVL